MELFFDTETSGFKNTDWIVQLGFILSDGIKNYTECNLTIQADKRQMNKFALAVHGITPKQSMNGINEQDALRFFIRYVEKAETIVCHNYAFDSRMLLNLYNNTGFEHEGKRFANTPYICTMLASKDYCKLPQKNCKTFKWPKLEELYNILFEKDFDNAHDALSDVKATMKCYYKLKELGVIK